MCVFKEKARVKGDSFEREKGADMFMDHSDSGSPRAECCCSNDSLKRETVGRLEGGTIHFKKEAEF